MGIYMEMIFRAERLDKYDRYAKEWYNKQNDDKFNPPKSGERLNIAAEFQDDVSRRKICSNAKTVGE